MNKKNQNNRSNKSNNYLNKNSQYKRIEFNKQLKAKIKAKWRLWNKMESMTAKWLIKIINLDRNLLKNNQLNRQYYQTSNKINKISTKIVNS